jgi:L-ascorbate 6-phosphate lactonase
MQYCHSMKTIESSLHYVFTKNDPYDRQAPIELVVPQLLSSRAYMESIRRFFVPTEAIALWYLGQNGFLLKDSTGLLIGIDPYLSNSCAATFSHLPFRLDRQLPIFIEPEDLDIDLMIATHSHADHADPETLRRLPKDRGMRFFGTFDSMRVFRECGVPESACRLLHPGETVPVSGGTTMRGTFALPTDDTDLNHAGILISFANGISYYNTGDTAWTERLPSLLPVGMDICSICINGGFHNLTPMEAASIVKEVRPRVVIPCHYDMMVNNVGSPEMLQVALDLLGSDASFHRMRYYEPWVYRRLPDAEHN